VNFADPFGLAVVFRGEQARQVWASLQREVLAWALSDDRAEQRKGTRLLGMMNRIYGSESVVEIGVDDPFGSGDPTANRTGPLGNGRLGINISMGQYGAVSLGTKLSHELGHAYAAIRLGMPIPDHADRRAVKAHEGVAREYENLYRSLNGCLSRSSWFSTVRPCQ
jgi:hypothetical protein